MTYNIHPLLVHFPIALLFLYSILKVLPLKKWFPQVAWRDIERMLLLVGVLGAFAALATGDTAEHLVRPNHQLVDMHSTFGGIATYIYGALLLGEIAAIFNTYKDHISASWKWLVRISLFVEKVLCNKIYACILAVAGLIAISITGMLGGVIAYGLAADPIAPVLLKLLGITLY
jgi:uncharacterized membrane protein